LSFTNTVQPLQAEVVYTNCCAANYYASAAAEFVVVVVVVVVVSYYCLVDRIGIDKPCLCDINEAEGVSHDVMYHQ
jgi:hypothetical protein